MKIRYRILFPTLIFFFIVGATFAFLFRYYLVQSIKTEFKENAITARKIIENHIRNISQEALTIAATLAVFPAVRDAYRLFDLISENPTPEEKAVYLKDTQNFLRGWMIPILKKIKETSGEKETLNIQFHYPPANSLLRLWKKPGDHDGGDDLSKFRPSILKVNKTHQSLMGIEVGKEGILIRGIASIDDEENHLGSVECFFPLKRITTIFQGISTESLIIYVLRSSLLKVPHAISKRVERSQFVKVLSTGDPEFEQLLTPTLLVRGLKGNSFHFKSFKGIFVFPIKDITGNVVGVTVYGKDYTERLASFKKTAFGIIAFFTVAFCILAIILELTEKSITRPLSVITEALHQLATGTADLSFRLKRSRKDEIGAVAAAFNRFMEEMDNLKRFKSLVEDDESLTDVYRRIAVLLKEQFHLDNFTIYEVNNSKNHLIPVIVEGTPKKGNLWCDSEILTDANHCRAKRTSKEVAGFDDFRVCPKFAGDENKTYLCIPMIVGDTTGAVLQIVMPKDKKQKIIGTLGRLKTYLSECSPVIGSKRLVGLLRDTSTRDALTGLLNRRYLSDSVDTLTAGIIRRKTHMGVLMVDIDFFKQVNDNFGHEVGDKILRSVARLLKESVRRSDIVIRYGGEEFLILLVDVEIDMAPKLADKIRETVENYSFKLTGSVLKKTISIGVSVYPDDTQNFWQCVKYADVALYKAKEMGRNRVVVFEKGMWQNDEY